MKERLAQIKAIVIMRTERYIRDYIYVVLFFVYSVIEKNIYSGHQFKMIFPDFDKTVFFHFAKFL